MTITDDERRLLAASAKALLDLADGLQMIINNMEKRTTTEAQDQHLLLTAGGFPQKEPSATQDWFTNEPGYDVNVSGRMA